MGADTPESRKPNSKYRFIHLTHLLKCTPYPVMHLVDLNTLVFYARLSQSFFLASDIHFLSQDYALIPMTLHHNQLFYSIPAIL